LLRMDWNLAEAHTLMLRLDGRWTSDDPARVRSLALPSTGGRRSERAGGVMASWTSHFGQLINEVRGYVSAEHADAGGFLAVREDVSWLSQDATHRIKLGGYLNSVRLRANQTPNQLGTFVFHSLDAFAAGQPSSFSRTLAPLYRAGTSLNEALYLGDTWRAG